MTDQQVIAAIRKNHLKANIAPSVRLRWAQATVDPGGTIFGLGPYLKVPVFGDSFGIRVRVYAPERLRKRLAAQWKAGT